MGTAIAKKSNPLKWHGGKSYLSSWIRSHFPPEGSYTHYCEPYAGGLAVLLDSDGEGISEAVNDIHEELANFWSVLITDGDEFIRAASLIPLSQKIWENSFLKCGERSRIDRALSFFVRYRQSRQGIGKDYCTPTKRVRRGMNENVSAWLSAVDGLREACERLRRVEVCCMEATDFIVRYDHKYALFYLDPPYMKSTRSAKDVYDYEMEYDDHLKLLKTLSMIEGRFLLSGYESKLYSELAEEFGWVKVSLDIDNKASGSAVKEKKTECLWMNYES